MKSIKFLVLLGTLTLGLANANGGTSSSGGTLSPLGQSTNQIRAILESDLVQNQYQFKWIKKIKLVQENTYFIEFANFDGTECVAELVKLVALSGSEVPKYNVVPSGAAVVCQ